MQNKNLTHSGEIETVVQSVLDYLHNNVTASIIYEDFHDFSKGVKGAEVDYFPETANEIMQEMGAQWQKEQSQSFEELQKVIELQNETIDYLRNQSSRVQVIEMLEKRIWELKEIRGRYSSGERGFDFHDNSLIELTNILSEFKGEK